MYALNITPFVAVSTVYDNKILFCKSSLLPYVKYINPIPCIYKKVIVSKITFKQLQLYVFSKINESFGTSIISLKSCDGELPLTPNSWYVMALIITIVTGRVSICNK